MCLYLKTNPPILKTVLIKLLFFGLISFQLYSQELLPFVENYNKSNYQGDNQIWNIVQGNDKAMYFANNSYLLRYDGVQWEKYSLPDKTMIRSLFVDGDKIYSGSYKEFGYWYRKEGKMIYYSISGNKKINNSDGIQDVWKIFKYKNNIYFQTFNDIFIYNGKEVNTINFPFLISYCFQVDKKLIVASVNGGIFLLNNSKIEKIPNREALENNVIHAIEKYKNKTYYFTRKNGVYVEENEVLSPWKNALNDTLKSSNINSAKFIANNKLIIGTASKGVFILDLTKNTYTKINRNNILMNNSILSIYEDKEKNIWLGLDNGIAHIEVNSPTAIFYDRTGVLGSVYSVATTKNGFLLASNHGVFKYENNIFSLISNAQGQAWDIKKIDDKYVIGHDEGTFLYENQKYLKLNSKSGGWYFTKSTANDTYLQATYSGVLFYKDSNDLSQSNELKGFYKPIKYVSQSKNNEIWAADKNKGLYRVTYNNNYETLKVENVTQDNKIANDFGVKIFEFRSEVLFLIHNSWYTYNYIAEKLEINKLFNTNFKNISDIVSIDEKHFLVLQDGILYQIYADGTKFVRNIIHEKYYKGKIINDNLKVFKDKNNYLLNLDDGFISLQLRCDSTQKATVKIEAFNENRLVQNDSKIKYNTEIRINVITGLFGAKSPNIFYKLNESPNYSPIKNGQIVLNNLKSSTNTVSIYQNDGLHYVKVSSFKFTVTNPWYFSFWMIMLYLLLLGTILYVYYKWNKLRYNQRLRLREEELKHQKEILEMELKAENQLSSQEYEKYILELELKSKSSEVTGKSLSIAKQGEMIENIQKILESETDVNKLKNEIKKAIKINSINKHEWEIFETNLNQIHNEFIINLSKKYPILTPKDIKLCIYLKMNLSSKEIAPMMNISFRGVDLHRYRLRKKLNLSQDENIYKFLLSV
jgi:DNA-binding CsgD family transcriptional regulator/cbb3-type cytochrome oxidase subunit 3